MAKESTQNVTPEDALHLVNQAREALDLEALGDLPRGVLQQPGACPIAQALPADSVIEDAIRFVNRRAAEAVADAWLTACQPIHCPDFIDAHSVALPADLRDFVRDFDAQAYPELIQGE